MRAARGVSGLRTTALAKVALQKPIEPMKKSSLNCQIMPVHCISSVHGLQARVLLEDDQLLALRAEVCSVHSHSVRAGSGLQAGAGDGMPGPACCEPACCEPSCCGEEKACTEAGCCN